MVSLRQLENTAAIKLVKRDELPWQQIREDLFYWLLKRDVSESDAEELVDAAIVRVFGTMPDPSHVANPGRIKLDVRMTIGSIRHEQAIEKGWFAESSEEHEVPEDCHASRLSRLTPMKTTTYVNDAIKLRRETERLLKRFGWLVSSQLPEPADDCPQSTGIPVWCFVFDDSFHASLPIIQDTWQSIPVKYQYSSRSYGGYAIAYRTAIDDCSAESGDSLPLFFRTYVELPDEDTGRPLYHVFAPPAN